MKINKDKTLLIKVLLLLIIFIQLGWLLGHFVQITFNAPFCKTICVWTVYLDDYGGWEPHKIL